MSFLNFFDDRPRHQPFGLYLCPVKVHFAQQVLSLGIDKSDARQVGHEVPFFPHNGLPALSKFADPRFRKFAFNHKTGSRAIVKNRNS